MSVLRKPLAVLAVLCAASLFALPSASAADSNPPVPNPEIAESPPSISTQPSQLPVQLTPSLMAEIRTVTSVADLDNISPNARRAIVTPVYSHTSFNVTTKYMKPGCDGWTITRKRTNVLGWTLIEATQRLYNVCRSGDQITSSPTQTRYANGSWGWTACGWTATHDGWITQDRVYGAGGWAQFALANSCFAPQFQLGVEIQANAPDRTWYGYTSG